MKAQIVSFHCVLKSKLGKVLSTSFNQDVINQLGEGSRTGADQSLRGLVAGIQNVHAGEHRRFTVPANEAYGPYNPDLVIHIPRSDLLIGDQLGIGSEVITEAGPNGQRQVFRVTEIHGDTLVLDANHPLAGHDLTFEIDVVSAREARREDFEEPLTQTASRSIH